MLQTDVGIPDIASSEPEESGWDFDPSTFDVWLGARYVHVDRGEREGDLGIFTLGADYMVNPDSGGMGVLGQIDIFDQDVNEDDWGGSAEGTGWMVGPYVVGRVGEGLLFEGRALWGLSENSVTPFDGDESYSDDFETQRWLVRGSVSGDVDVGEWTVTPSFSGSYFEETQDSYVDSWSGLVVDEQTVDTGRLTFGASVSRAFILDNGFVLTPRFGIDGIWDFEASNQVDVDGVAIYSDGDVRAGAEAGLRVQMLNGMSVTIDGSYDGLGDDNLDAYGGSVQISVPLR